MRAARYVCWLPSGVCHVADQQEGVRLSMSTSPQAFWLFQVCYTYQLLPSCLCPAVQLYSATDHKQYGRHASKCPSYGYCSNCMPLKVQGAWQQPLVNYCAYLLVTVVEVLIVVMINFVPFQHSCA